MTSLEQGLPREWRIGALHARGSAEAAAALGLGSLPVLALGSADGGFFPRTWGWAAFGFACAALVAATARRELQLSRRPALLLGLLLALGLWIAASLVWTRSVSSGVFELQRLLVYVTGVGAATLVIRRRTARVLVLGVFLGTGTVAIWGLVSYFLTREGTTDVFQGSFLHRPAGYANAMAIIAVIAFLLALGIVSDSPSRLVRIGAAVSLVPLASALVLTGSRAAWGALCVGAATSFALSPNRMRVLTAWAEVLIAPAVAVVLMSGANVTSSRITGVAADRLGDRLLATVVMLMVLAVGPALLATRRPVSRARAVHRLRFRVLLFAALVVVAVGGLALRGLAGDRPMFWEVAVDEFREHPVLGSGSGTYAQVWLERRSHDVSVRDAHSLVVEALSELGIVGFLLVVVLLGAPIAWGIRARASPLAPAVTGAFGAYAAHTCVDWDWEMPAVTLAGLFCAFALGSTADGGSRRVLGTGGRCLAVAAGSIAAALALAGLVGAVAMEDASRALARGDLSAADVAATRAARWQPWSADPLLVGGRARLSMGDRAAARALFVRAAARDPNDYRAWLALAAVTEGDVARAAVARARSMNPRAVHLERFLNADAHRQRVGNVEGRKDEW